jgi:hypothetical protein
MKEIREKLILLFDDINKYYNHFNRDLSLNDFEKGCFDDISIERFFEQIFKDREFNVKVSKQYLVRILSDYDLELDDLNRYKKELKRIKNEEDERIKIEDQEKLEKIRLESIQRKRKNIIYFSLFITVAVSLGLYVDRYNKEKAIERVRIAEEKENRILSQKKTIEKYLLSYGKNDVITVMDFWAENPYRYYDVRELSSKEDVESQVLNTMTVNRSIVNEILDIENLRQNSFDVSIIQKVINRDVGIERHIEKTINLVLDEDDKITQEFSRGSESTFFVSVVVRDYSDGRYVGGILNDKRSNYGEMFYKNGDVFKGQWMNGERNGYGEMFYKNGDVFKGQWNGYNKVEGEMIYSSKGEMIYSSKGDNKVSLPNNPKPNSTDLFWAEDQPNEDNEYVYFQGSNGKWYTSGNLHKNAYGLYEIDRPISQIYGFVYVGTFDGHSYFRSIGITHIRLPYREEKSFGAWTVAYSMTPKVGYLVEINTPEEQEYLQNKLKGTFKDYWIGMKLVDGEYKWIGNQ